MGFFMSSSCLSPPPPPPHQLAYLRDEKLKERQLKVPSGQIESTWEWYHWIGLEKDINRYRFFNFLISILNIWKDFKVLSRFMQKWIQPPLVLITVCIESCLSIGWCTFNLRKNLSKRCLIFIWICGTLEFFTQELQSKEQLMTLPHFWSTVGGKDRGLSTCKQWSKQLGGWINFCKKQLRTLNSYQIFKIKKKKKKTYSGWCPFQGLSKSTTQIQIQSGQTVLKGTVAWDGFLS